MMNEQTKKRKGLLRKAGIQFRLTILILAVALIPLSLLGYKAFNDQKEIIIKEVTESHVELSNVLAHGIYENLEFTRRLLDTIGDLEAINLMHKGVSGDLFKALMRQFPFFRLIYLINNEKKIIATTDPSVELPKDWLFSKAIQRSYQGALSTVVTPPGGVPYMTLESIIKSPKNSGIVGVIISEVNLFNIRELLKNALKNSKSQGLVLDEVGNIIAKSSDLARPLNMTADAVMEEDLTRLNTIDGEPYLITAVSLKKFDFYQAPNWTIVLQVPESVAFEATEKFKVRISQILLVTTLIAILFAFLLSHTFTAPLNNLIEGAKFLSKGDFEHKIVPHRDDEIGDLTITFDEMRVNLKNTREDLDYRILQLETLYEVGKIISSELNFKKLQNMILEIVAKVIKAEKGSLMILDDTENVLTIGVAVGLSEEITRDTRMEITQSIAGWVVRNKKPLYIKDVEKDEVFRSIKKENVQKGTLMCMPLIAKDKILGTLNVSKSVPGGFNERDFETFKSLANQAAIAIDNARLYRYAVTDEMTKLYNHRYFQQRLDEELQRSVKHETHVALMILDVDHFKKFNDTYGHQEGDRVLKTVARLVESNIREIDVAARYGGEEFCVICPEIQPNGALIPAERIRTAIENYDFRINGKPVLLRISIGVACYPDNAVDKKDLIKKADTALYYSKENGRNRSTLFETFMDTSKSEK